MQNGLFPLLGHYSLIIIFNYSSGVSNKINSLLSKAQLRLHLAFRNSTAAAYSTKFRVLIAFCIFANISLTKVATNHILAFLKFLVFNQVSISSITNYLSAIKAKVVIYDLIVSAFQNPKVKYFTKSLTLMAPLRVSLKAVIDLDTLTSIVKRSDTMYMEQIFKAAFYSPSSLSYAYPIWSLIQCRILAGT